MAAAVSDGPVGCLRSRDDVPLSRTAEFRCAGRREHDGAPGDESGFWAGFGAPAVPAGLDAVPRVRGGEQRAVPRRDDRAFEARPLLRRLRRQAPPFGALPLAPPRRPTGAAPRAPSHGQVADFESAPQGPFPRLSAAPPPIVAQ